MGVNWYTVIPVALYLFYTFVLFVSVDLGRPYMAAVAVFGIGASIGVLRIGAEISAVKRQRKERRQRRLAR